MTREPDPIPEPDRIPEADPDTVAGAGLDGTAEPTAEPVTATDPVTEPELATDAEPATPAKPAPGRLDAVLTDMLRRRLALDKVPGDFSVRVVGGVASYAGRVPDRRTAETLRELTRNFDGIRRVTGSLWVTEADERVPMDAVAD